jgi:predicted ester cyclase
MSDAENVAVMQRWFDAVNAHDADRLADVLDEAFVWEGVRTSGLGVQATAAAWRTLFSAFPDLRLEPEQVLVQGDAVIARWRMTGTHLSDFALTGPEGPLRPVAATNRRIDLPGCSVSEVQHGRIVRSWVYGDIAMLLRQLGLLTSHASWP